MTSCLWADIDTYLETQLLAELGAGGLYSTLVVQQVIVDDVWGLDEAIKNNAFPLVLVRSNQGTQSPGAHGGGAVRVENSYEYMLVGIVRASGKREAKAGAQEMRRRFREFLRTRLSLGGLTAGDGERVQKIVWGGSQLEVWGRADRDAGTYYGVAALDFKVMTM